MNLPPIQIAIQSFKMAVATITNPWGDYDRMVAIHFRSPEDSSTVAPPIYYKINKNNHQPTAMTEGQFKDACVEAVMAQAQPPAIFELP